MENEGVRFDLTSFALGVITCAAAEIVGLFVTVWVLGWI